MITAKACSGNIQIDLRDFFKIELIIILKEGIVIVSKSIYIPRQANK